MKKLFWELYLRITSESSKFFKWLGGILVVVSATGVGLGSLADTVIVWKGQSLHNMLIIAGVVGAIVCRLTVKDTDILNAKIADKVA